MKKIDTDSINTLRFCLSTNPKGQIRSSRLAFRDCTFDVHYWDRFMHFNLKIPIG